MLETCLTSLGGCDRSTDLLFEGGLSDVLIELLGPEGGHSHLKKLTDAFRVGM